MKTKRFERVCSITIHWSGKTSIQYSHVIWWHRLFIKLKKLQETTQFANIYNSKRFALKGRNSSQLYVDLPRPPDFGIGDQWHRLRSTGNRSVALFRGYDSWAARFQIQKFLLDLCHHSGALCTAFLAGWGLGHHWMLDELVDAMAGFCVESGLREARWNALEASCRPLFKAVGAICKQK